MGRGEISHILEGILNAGFEGFIFQGDHHGTLHPTVPGENFFSPSYLQVRKFFIRSRIVQAA